MAPHCTEGSRRGEGVRIPLWHLLRWCAFAVIPLWIARQVSTCLGIPCQSRSVHAPCGREAHQCQEGAEERQRAAQQGEQGAVDGGHHKAANDVAKGRRALQAVAGG